MVIIGRRLALIAYFWLHNRHDPSTAYRVLSKKWRSNSAKIRLQNRCKCTEYRSSGCMMEELKMKLTKTRIITLALTAMTALSLIACSSGNSSAPGGNNNKTTSPAPEINNNATTPSHIQEALTPISSNSIQEYDYEDIGKMFADAGFTKISTAELFDIDPDFDDSIYRNVVSIGNTTTFENAEAFPFDSAISIICHRPCEKYTVSIHVDFVPNLIFSKYDVDLLIDDVKQETLKHGEDADLEFRLKAGVYPIVFANSASSSVNGSAEINVEGDIMVSYKIACYSDKVTVEDMTTQLLEQLQAQAAEDERKAAEAAAAEKAAEMMRALEGQLPQKMAKRAAIVAITNYTAVDVFMPDGDTLDVSKFHSYSDTSGNFFDYYISVKSWGEWSAKDEETWHAEELSYVNCFGNTKNAAFNVRYDGENYIVSNLVITFGDLNNPSRSGIDEYSTELVVAPELIKDDRRQTRLESYSSWVNDQFSIWDGSHKDFTALIKKNLNDEKSYKHIETTYRIIYSEDIKDEVNNVLQSANKSNRVDIGDIFVSTEFSAKNAFNATIKNTAYGIVSFEKNSITLIAIE